MTPTEERSCASKIKFKTRSGAVFAANALLLKSIPVSEKLSNGAFRRLRKGFLDAYECQFCGSFHVGHVPASIRETLPASYSAQAILKEIK